MLTVLDSSDIAKFFEPSLDDIVGVVDQQTFAIVGSNIGASITTQYGCLSLIDRFFRLFFWLVALQPVIISLRM